MRKDNLLPTLFLAIIVGLFLYGIVELLIMRFQAGNIYPPYSSYRTDPLGTKALYDALGQLPGVKTRRNAEPIKKVPDLSGATIFLIGVDTAYFSHMETTAVLALEDVASGGGRIVITFVPTQEKAASPDEAEKQEIQKKEGNEQKKEEQELASFKKGFVDLGRQWSVEIGLSTEQSAGATLRATENDLPQTLAWDGTRVFHPLDTTWHVVYAAGDKAVVIERAYGKGTICLAADSFLLSNEAMKVKRYPLLLSWLCGTNRRIIFDETHLGIAKASGVATLLRQYGLVPFVISLIVLALLAIWRKSVSLIPPREEEREAVLKLGKDYSSGLTNMLRRNITSDGILTICLEEWKRTFTHGKSNLSSLLPVIQEIIAAEQARPKKTRDVVHAYRQISEVLSPPRATGAVQRQMPSPPRGETITKQRHNVLRHQKNIRKKNG